MESNGLNTNHLPYRDESVREFLSVVGLSGASIDLCQAAARVGASLAGVIEAIDVLRDGALENNL